MTVNETFPHLTEALARTNGTRLESDLRRASPHTYRHSKRVEILALRMGCAIPHVPGSTVLKLGFSARLHDIGKIDPAILELVESDRILGEAEKQQINEVHTRQGSAMINGLVAGNEYEALVGTAAYVALHHHDDITALTPPGEPRSEEAEINGLIQAVDIFEAVQAVDRPYRQGQPLVDSPEKAALEVQRQVTVQPFFDFDPVSLMNMLVQVSRR
jgi:HD-GYP domain-containing protein (c-di-GMP phosphodiesterase class II)